MKQGSINKRRWADLSLLTSTILYLFINGAGAFETAVIVPVWTSDPPASLAMFQGEYGLDFKTFWIAAHSIHEITFIAAIILNWNIPQRRKVLLVVFVIHVALRAWTITYFAPTIISFQEMMPSNITDEALRQKAQLWENLNLIRTGLFTILSFVLVPLNRRVFDKQ
jgi:hypothetical protein